MAENTHVVSYKEESEGIEETDGGGFIPGFVLLIREFEISDPANTTPRPTGYFRIEFSKKDKNIIMRERQKGNPRNLKVVREYQEGNALNTHKAATEAVRNKKVDGKEGWYFLPPDGNETWSKVEEQITEAIQGYNNAWGLK